MEGLEGLGLAPWNMVNFEPNPRVMTLPLGLISHLQPTVRGNCDRGQGAQIPHPQSLHEIAMDQVPIASKLKTYVGLRSFPVLTSV